MLYHYYFFKQPAPREHILSSSCLAFTKLLLMQICVSTNHIFPCWLNNIYIRELTWKTSRCETRHSIPQLKKLAYIILPFGIGMVLLIVIIFMNCRILLITSKKRRATHCTTKPTPMTKRNSSLMFISNCLLLFMWCSTYAV